MEIQLKFNKKEFVDMITKMAIPTIKSKEGFINSYIYPSFSPVYKNDKNITCMLEWIAKSSVVTTWVRMGYDRNLWLSFLEDHDDLIEPIRIPIDVKNVLKVLKNFTDKDYIFFIYDPDKNIQTITDNITCIRMPVISWEPGKEVFKGYPGNIDPETEIIIFKDNMRPDISGSLRVEFLQDAFAAIKSVCPKKNDNRVYSFEVDGDKHQIKAYTNEEDIKIGNVFSKKHVDSSIKGHGELHYSEFFEYVVDVLSDDFEFYTIDCGPLWIKQDSDNMKVRYLIAPAAKETY